MNLFMVKLLYRLGKRDFSNHKITGKCHQFCFTSCIFRNTKFTSVRMKDVSFFNCVFRDTHFELSYILGSSFDERSPMIGCTFDKCCVEHGRVLTSFEDVNIDESVFYNVEFRKMFTDVKVFRTSMLDCRFKSILSYIDHCVFDNANMSGSIFSGVTMTRHNKIDNYTSFINSTCPSDGSYIGWKCASGYIIKLLITKDALRSSATSRKCRASKAKVLDIQNIDGTSADVKCVNSDNDVNFKYEKGNTVEVMDFNENRWAECASGIHHFITREEAVAYLLNN